MKYAPLILSLACLAGGLTLVIVGRNEPAIASIGSGLIGAFLGQFAPSAHTTFQKTE